MWIIGRDFNLGGLAGANEGDFIGLDAGDDFKLFINGYDFDQLHCRFDHAAERFDGDIIDNAINRGFNLAPINAIANGFETFAQ